MSEVTEKDRRRIERYMSLDMDDLVALIPTVHPDYKRNVFNTDGQVKAGWKEFDKIKTALIPILCVDWDMCTKIKSEQYKDAINLISAIADVIAAHSGFVPPFLASTIIVRMGVRHLCDCPK